MQHQTVQESSPSLSTVGIDLRLCIMHSVMYSAIILAGDWSHDLSRDFVSDADMKCYSEDSKANFLYMLKILLE